jgi:hypothetical protein
MEEENGVSRENHKVAAAKGHNDNVQTIPDIELV